MFLHGPAPPDRIQLGWTQIPQARMQALRIVDIGDEPPEVGRGRFQGGAKTGQPTTGMTVRTCWRLIARLGGHQGRRGDGEPGWETVVEGLTRRQLARRGAPPRRLLGRSLRCGYKSGLKTPGGAATRRPESARAAGTRSPVGHRVPQVTRSPRHGFRTARKAIDRLNPETAPPDAPLHRSGLGTRGGRG